MNSDERIYRQVEELSSSIIKALEALEKELSQYIEITDKRLHTLEDKVQKLESLVDVSSRGLVKSFEHQREITTPSPTSLPQPKPIQPTPQPTTISPPTPQVEKPITTSIPTVHQSPPQPPHTAPEIIKTPETTSLKPTIISTQSTTTTATASPTTPQSEVSRFPPIPKPPSFEATLEKKSDEELLDIPERDDSVKKHEGNIAEEIENKEKKETDKDKEELLFALKMIDNL